MFVVNALEAMPSFRCIRSIPSNVFDIAHIISIFLV